MRDKGKLRKWVWLVLVVAFAAIAGGGCGGSSSNGGGGNVRPIGDADHPLYDALKEHYVDMPNGTIFIGKNVTRDELEAHSDELRAAYEDERIIGMYAPTQERVDDLYDVLGIDIFRELTTEDIAGAAAGDEEELEFYMIKQHEGLIFLNRQHYVGKGTFGAEFMQRGPFLISADEEISDYAADTPVEPVGDKSEAYPQIAAAVASWNGQVAAHAEKVKAEGAAVRGAIRAAAGPIRLDTFARPIINTNQFTFADQPKPSVVKKLEDKDSPDNKDCRFKFPTICMTTTMYSCYSFQEDANYYMVVMNADMNNEKNYHHWTWQGPDFEQNAARRYRSRPQMQHIPSDAENIKLLDHQPGSYSDGYNEYNEVRFDVSGSVGSIGDAGAQGSTEQVNLGVTDGVYLTHRKRYEIKDYNVSPLRMLGRYPWSAWTEYVFDLPKEDNSIWNKKLREASEASRNFSSEESWVWRIARSEKDAYSFEHFFDYDVVLMKGGASILWIPLDWLSGELTQESWVARVSAGYGIHLPIPPTLALSVSELTVSATGLLNGDKPVTFDIFSDGDWKLECDADWVTIPKTTGGKTQHQNIGVTVAPNPSARDRRATITATGTPDPNGRLQKTKLMITQEAMK